MTLEAAKDLSFVIGGIVALITLMMTYIEFSRQNASKRAEFFLSMRRRLKENAILKDLSDQVERKVPGLADVPLKDKFEYVGFFEEVALMVNSGIMHPEVAHYMFAYYAISCWESAAFWTNGMNRESPFWAMFRDFVDRMKTESARFKYSRQRFRL